MNPMCLDTDKPQICEVTGWHLLVEKSCQLDPEIIQTSQGNVNRFCLTVRHKKWNKCYNDANFYLVNFLQYEDFYV